MTHQEFLGKSGQIGLAYTELTPVALNGPQKLSLFKILRIARAFEVKPEELVAVMPESKKSASASVVVVLARQKIVFHLPSQYLIIASTCC